VTCQDTLHHNIAYFGTTVGSQLYSASRQTTMAPTLYISAGSPAVRAVQITAKAIGLELNLKELDFMKGEHLQPEYLKLNPQHTVPTLVDSDGFTLWDSHAINVYLVAKYAKSDNLYPKDLKTRALVDQRLHFDSGVAFARGLAIVAAIFNTGKTSLDDSDKESLGQVYSFLEAFLEGKQYMTGDSVTLADYSLFPTITSWNVVFAVDAQKYPRLTKWLKTIESRPEAEVNKKGQAIFETMIKSKLT
jgi:glutathione S-transferase